MSGTEKRATGPGNKGRAILTVAIAAGTLAACAPAPVYSPASARGAPSSEIPRDVNGDPVWDAIPPPPPGAIAKGSAPQGSVPAPKQVTAQNLYR